MSPFDLKLLVYFVAVAEQASFRRAAEKLRIAQPWLSRQVRKLETQLGFALFERTTRRVELTERGAQLFESARRAVREAEAVFVLAQTLREPQGRTLRLGVAPYALLVEARAELCDAFLARAPASKIEIEIGMGAKLRERLAEGALDAACLLAPETETPDDGVLAATLCSGGIDVVIPKDDPLARKGAIAAEDVAKREIATFAKDANSEMFDLVFGAFRAAGARFVEFSDFSFYRNLAPRRLITALPEWQPSPVGGVVRRPYADFAGALRLQLLRRRKDENPAVETFWKLAAARPAPRLELAHPEPAH